MTPQVLSCATDSKVCGESNKGPPKPGRPDMPRRRRRIAVTVAVVAASVTMMVTTVNTHVAVAAVSGVLFADNFTGMAPGVPFAEGERRGQWIATYNGYGLTQVERDAEKGAVLSQAPQATSQEDVT